MKDEGAVRLREVAPGPKSRLYYEYDFGDSWEHEILLEKVTAREPGANYPRCVVGKRACPPEDCGGVWGYENFRQEVFAPAALPTEVARTPRSRTAASRV